MSPGNVVTITAVFSHQQGAANLTNLAVIVGSTPTVDFSCFVTYLPGTNQLRLANNLAASGSVSITPGSGTASRSPTDGHRAPLQYGLPPTSRATSA